MRPQEILQSIDFGDPDIRAQLMSLVPYLMEDDISGITRGFKRIDSPLQEIIIVGLNEVYDLIGKVLEQIDPDAEYVNLENEWPDTIGTGKGITMGNNARQVFENIIAAAQEGLAIPEETGDVAAYKAEAVKLRGILRGVYSQAQELQLGQSVEKSELTPRAEEAWKKINNGTINYSEPTQVIVGETTDIPIPDMFE